MKLNKIFVVSGIAEIFKTPAHSRQRKSVAEVQNVLETPQRPHSTLMTDTSVMNTPEETGMSFFTVPRWVC